VSNLVIVAIPEKDDPVWKVSTEKVPHLTLLFLGEMQDNDGDLTEDVQRVVDFVGHAVDVAEHGPFMLDVDYRDTLGPDNADVLFFSKDWSFKWINQFRNQLLQQSDIRTAYDSTPQYPEWQPHLTLGYPTAPAKDDAVEHPIRWIGFDRIAVWTGDYEGPEFRLQWPQRDFGIESGLSVAYGESAVTALLRHGSVLDVKATRDRIVTKVQSILEDVTGDADNDLNPDDPDDTILEKLRDLINEFTDDDELAQSAFETMLAHYGIKGVAWDPKRSVPSAKVMELGEAFILEHYGIKGMHWGRRKAEGGDPTPVTPQAFSRVPRGAKRKTKIDTTGGENHPAHEDAVKVARAQAKLKKSGAAALSNQELRDVATRVQLEQQVSMLTGHRGKQWVNRQLRTEGENIARSGFRTGVRKGIKRAGVAALI
jgi:2'-5' RNA ligase